MRTANLNQQRLEGHVWLFKYAAAAIVLGGIVLAVALEKYEIVNRFGVLLVMISFFLTLAQFSLERAMPPLIRESLTRASGILERKGVPAEIQERVAREWSTNLEGSFEESRRRILMQSLIVAGLGEFLHGFGDLFLEVSVHLLSFVLEIFHKAVV